VIDLSESYGSARTHILRRLSRDFI